MGPSFPTVLPHTVRHGLHIPLRVEEKISREEWGIRWLKRGQSKRRGGMDELRRGRRIRKYGIKVWCWDCRKELPQIESTMWWLSKQPVRCMYHSVKLSNQAQMVLIHTLVQGPVPNGGINVNLCLSGCHLHTHTIHTTIGWTVCNMGVKRCSRVPPSMLYVFLNEVRSSSWSPVTKSSGPKWQTDHSQWKRKYSDKPADENWNTC